MSFPVKDILYKTIRVKGCTLKVIAWEIRFPGPKRYMVEEYKQEMMDGTYEILMRKILGSEIKVKQRNPMMIVTGIDLARWNDWEEQNILSDEEPYNRGFYTVARVKELKAEQEGKQYKLPEPITVQFTKRAKIEILEDTEEAA